MAEWHAEAKRLRAEGLTYREIGERLGKPLQTVWSAVMDDNLRRRPQKRAWEHAHDRADCPECGRPMGIGAKRKGYTICRACWVANAERRRAEVIEGYGAGLSVAEISERTGIPRTSIPTIAWELRQQGVDLPLGKRGRPPKVAA